MCNKNFDEVEFSSLLILLSFLNNVYVSYHSGENLDSMTTPFDLMIGSVRSFRCIFEKRNSQSHNYGPFQTSEAQLERRIGPLLCSHARCAVTKVESVSYLWAEFPVCGRRANADISSRYSNNSYIFSSKAKFF